jgi:predicted metal-dependent enzyme (double-stranded beta helix superfamily)
MRPPFRHVSRRAFLAGAAGVVAASTFVRADPGRAVTTGKLDPDRLVEDLRRAGRASDGQRAVDEVLARTISDPSRLLAALGEPRAAGLHTLHHGQDLTILNVVWAPLMMLFPHNHNMWASIAIYTGREDNIIWERKEGAVIEAAGAASLSEKEVFPLPKDAIHSVSNPIRRYTGAIHVYGGDFFAPAGRVQWDPETLREEPFDLEAARAAFREANEGFRSGR